MRTLLITAIGATLALAFHFVVTALHQRGHARNTDGGRLFILIWMAIVIVDGWIGVDEGHGVLLEIGVHLVIFVVPAALAWYLSIRQPSHADSSPPG
jgi:choline-glycine betaine transporter